MLNTTSQPAGYQNAAKSFSKTSFYNLCIISGPVPAGMHNSRRVGLNTEKDRKARNHILAYLRMTKRQVSEKHIITFIALSYLPTSPPTYLPLVHPPTRSSTLSPTYPLTHLFTHPCTYLVPWLSPWLYVNLLVYLLAWLTGPKMTKKTEKDTLVVEEQAITPHKVPPHANA